MVIFLDFDRDSYDDTQHPHPGTILHAYTPPDAKTDVLAVKLVYTEPGPGFTWGNNGRQATDTRDDAPAETSNTSDNPNINAFSRCLGCYPYGLRHFCCNFSHVSTRH
jgi:hypothetical protein